MIATRGSFTGRGPGSVGSLVLVAALTLGALACSSTGRQANPFNSADDFSDEIEISISNLNFADATIYTVRGGQRRRLGSVVGKNDERFTIPWRFTDPLQFEIRLLAGDRCLTRPIDVRGGDAVFLEIQPNLRADPNCIPI